MEAFQYNVMASDGFNASGKAKEDIQVTLRTMGIKDMYQPSRYRFVRVIQQIVALAGLRKDKNNVLIVQYPAVIDNFLKYASQKATTLAVIHDLESLRGLKTVAEEIDILNRFDVVISHNSRMTKYLKENKLNSTIINLDIFDYLVDDPTNELFDVSKRRVCFAGNLNKSVFLNNLSVIKDTEFLLYGLFDNRQMFDQTGNINYCGSLPSSQIVSKLDGEFGLVWDGPSVDTCEGTLGHYLKYNNPHKMSLYLVANKPVIIWRGAAQAAFVEKFKVGIVVDSLTEIGPALSNISNSEYLSMRKNVAKISAKLASGFYTKTAMSKALASL